MDYRELENRMQRNRDLIKERQYDRLIAEAKKANQPLVKRRNWLVGLLLFMKAIVRRTARPQAHVHLKPQHRFENH